MANDQYLRKVQLIVARGTEGIDLSEFRIQFVVQAQDYETPNTAYIRVYNLATTTVQKIKGDLPFDGEYTRVILSAGYQTGNFGVIFDGTIKQYRTGRESPTDTYLDIFAADGDIGFQQALLKQTLRAGATPQQIAGAIGDAFKDYGVTMSDIQGMTFSGVRLSRGKVMFGLARDAMRRFAQTQFSSWSIQQGNIVVTRLNSYKPGEIVEMNMSTGMVGVPEATDSGIAVRCLLNPKIQVGTVLHIDNTSINQTQIVEQFFPGYNEVNFVAETTDYGYYRVPVSEYEGDTRDTAWYSRLTCLAIDMTAAKGDEILPFGSQGAL